MDITGVGGKIPNTVEISETENNISSRDRANHYQKISPKVFHIFVKLSRPKMTAVSSTRLLKTPEIKDMIRHETVIVV